MSVLKRYKRIADLIDKNIPDSYGRCKKLRVMLDFAVEKLRYNTFMSDYIQYEYYRKSNCVRREFIDENRRKIIHSTFNKESDCAIFNQKMLFNQKFAEFLHRDWLDVTTCTEEEFQKFILKHGKFFVKPADGWFGIGTGTYYAKDYKDYKRLYKDLMEKKAIIEECIVQHKEISEFNPSSVNTLRVVSVMLPDNSIKIMSADFRIGRKGKMADNFHNEGIAALIDVETGIVCTTGIDKRRQRHILHPDSGKQIVGYRIPLWDEVVKTVKKAAHVVPTVKYVGWDVAVSDKDEIIIVEGNCMADPDVAQMPDDKGKWKPYEEIIRLYKNN